ncbi:MAG: LacI family DNA-binding transcriptional regulator [Phycisphaerae bacterium]|nr:LacI family DNA-binding transcriptional regulator [Phycisphaerae bacterium]
MAATLKDIAQDSDLSMAVVSSVLRGGISGVRFSRETRQRVFKSAAKLNYQPRRTGNIGLLYCVGEDGRKKERNWIGHVSPMLSVLQNRCAEKDQLLTMYCYSAEELSEALRSCNLPKILRRRNTDGLVVMGIVTPELIEGIHEINMPYVMMNVNESDSHAENAVFFDDVFTGTLATNYLLDRGRKNILHITVDWNNHYSVRFRREGYEQALRQRGLKGRLLCRHPDQPERFNEELKAILTGPDRPDAIFAYNDAVAGCCQAVFLERRLNYDDVALMGVAFGNKLGAEYPGISYVKLPVAEMVDQAYMKLTRKLDSGENTPTVFLRGTIDDRGSVPDRS